MVKWALFGKIRRKSSLSQIINQENLFSSIVFTCSNLNQPNIVMFITDDQDSFLDGMEPMVKTKSWFESGQKFTNAFVSTPVCCPSRSSVLTGLYQHNTLVVNNSLAGMYSYPYIVSFLWSYQKFNLGAKISIFRKWKS